jgi:hypothetical protein
LHALSWASCSATCAKEQEERSRDAVCLSGYHGASSCHHVIVSSCHRVNMSSCHHVIVSWCVLYGVCYMVCRTQAPSYMVCPIWCVLHGVSYMVCPIWCVLHCVSCHGASSLLCLSGGHGAYLRLARTVYICTVHDRIFGDFPCQKYRTYTVYI